MTIRIRLRHGLSTLLRRPHLPRRTVRLRLTLLYGALFLASGVVLLATTYVLVSRATGDALFFHGPNGSVGAVIRSPGAPSKTDPQLPAQGFSAQGPNAAGLTPQQLEVQAREFEALAVRQHANQLHQLLVQSGIALGVMAILSIALGWLVAGRILRPLRTITATARDISASNLGERLALDGPDDELKELGDTFDGLLGRLEASFQSQRQFVANASHELRTPLARQRTLAQVALADPDASIESLRAAHERVLASGEQQERLIEALLTLARGLAGPDRTEHFDLAKVTEQVLLARGSEATYRGVDMHVTLSVAPMNGDRHLVERLVANLVDNALRHNVAHGHVEVAARTDAARAVVSVTNTGPVVPPNAVDRLLQPFQRLAPDRTGHGEGVGLGLSIVQAIAAAHDAELTVRPRPTGGLTVEVSFPASSPPTGSHVPPSLRKSPVPVLAAPAELSAQATEASTTLST
ncbi:MAG: hypothetical protein QOJ62_944 [Actinomycetota bacterium]|nr:hypothetical protein [Actinomycetota bacterium]